VGSGATRSASLACSRVRLDARNASIVFLPAAATRSTDTTTARASGRRLASGIHAAHAARVMRRVGQVGHDGEGGTVPGQGERRPWPVRMHLTKPSWVGAWS
jgi:hypothetical protein